VPEVVAVAGSGSEELSFTVIAAALSHQALTITMSLKKEWRIHHLERRSSLVLP